MDDTNLANCKNERVVIEKLNVTTQNHLNFTCTYFNKGGIGSIKNFLKKDLGINISSYDHILGLAITRPCSDQTIAGASDGKHIVWITSPSNPNHTYIAAHELGHNYGLEDQYCSNPAGSFHWKCNDADAGYWSDRGNDGSITGDVNYLDTNLGCNATEGGGCCEVRDYDNDSFPDVCDVAGGPLGYGICCDGNRNNEDGISTMSFMGAENFVLGPRKFDNHSKAHLATFSQLNCNGPGTPKPIIDVNLLIYKNNTVEEDSVNIHDGEITEFYDSFGNYTLEIYDKNLILLWNQTIDLFFGYDGPVFAGINYSGIEFDNLDLSIRIPFNENMHELKLLYNNVVIFNKTLINDLIFNFSQISEIGIQRIFEFTINNTINSTDVFTFEFNTTEELITNNIPIDLTGDESAIIYIENNFTVSGLHELTVVVRSSDYYDFEKINITI